MPEAAWMVGGEGAGRGLEGWLGPWWWLTPDTRAPDVQHQHTVCCMPRCFSRSGALPSRWSVRLWPNARAYHITQRTNGDA